MTATRRYVVELHDLSAADPTARSRMVACVPQPLVAQAAMLVVPDWYGSAPLRPVDALRVTDGASGPRVLHGLTHALGYRWVDRMWYGTANEGEFARLGLEDARHRLDRGVALLRAAFGEMPQWFCAPRWQLSAAGRTAARELGLGLLERDALVTPDGTRIPAPALWFDHGQRQAAQVTGRLQARVRVHRALGTGNAVRIALHPRDAGTPRSREAIAALFHRLDRDGWEPACLDALRAS